MDTIYCAAFESDFDELKQRAAAAKPAKRPAPAEPCATRPAVDASDVWYNEAGVRDENDARLRPFY